MWGKESLGLAGISTSLTGRVAKHWSFPHLYRVALGYGMCPFVPNCETLYGEKDLGGRVAFI